MNNIFTSVVCAVVGGVVAGAIMLTFVHNETTIQQVGSAVGSTFNTAKVAQVNISPSTSAASSTSILNGDASDRWIEGAFASCTGVGTSQTYLSGAGLASTGWTLLAATTSAASQNGNTLTAVVVTIATTSAFANVASTSASADVKADWPAGSYLTFWFNATNTAACTVGVHYHAS